jgi:hypothetical protein
MCFAAEDAADIERMFSEQFDTGSLGVGEWKDPVLGAIEIDGRETRCVRYFSREGGVPGGPAEARGPSIMLDLTRGDAPVLLQLTRISGDGEAVISDEEVIEFLAPFRPWGKE